MQTCFIVPCYNEETRFPVKQFTEFIDKSSVHFCFVNDGSSDNTLQMLNNLANGREEKVLILSLKVNSGKAEAVRFGILECQEWKKFDLIGYLDADLATPLFEINNLIDCIQLTGATMVLGSRVKLLGRKIERNKIRHYLGRVFATFASIILQIPVYDTQCGAKVMRIDKINAVFEERFISPWLFDIEIIARIIQLVGRKSAVETIVEMPLMEWKEIGQSRIKLTYLFKVPIELLRIRLKYKS